MISDDQLLLYHYGDGLTPEERATIGKALAGDAGLAARHASLAAELAALPAGETAVPAHVPARWRSALDAAAHGPAPAHTRAQRTHWRPRGFAVAAVAVLTVGVVMQWPRGEPGADNTPSPPVADAKPSAAQRSLHFHLARNGEHIAAIRTAQPGERERLIDRAILHNRMVALSAEKAGDARLARTLRSFTPILESLALSGASPAALEGALAQLDFELR
ncbi:MAG: hypothetical protein JNJ55_02905, partial [Betaproteobacteria bacterium]|nr:hypothetical protein [Betaproteobacteria bacterium]